MEKRHHIVAWTTFMFVALVSAQQHTQPLMANACNITTMKSSPNSKSHNFETCIVAKHGPKDSRSPNVKPDEFMCPPAILNKPEEIVVGAGSNVTLACSARGSPPLTFVWFQDEMNITGNAGGSTGDNSNQRDPPPSTKLLEERRYEIQEELSASCVTTSVLFLMNLKVTDTSVFLCWVENAAGYTIGNFSLVVNDSPPNYIVATGGTSSGLNGFGNSLGQLFGLNQRDSSIGWQVIVVLIASLLLLLLTVICLYILKQVTGNRSSKSSLQSKSDLKTQSGHHHNHHVQMNGNGNVGNMMASNGQMFALSDEDGATDDEDDHHSSASGGACSSGSQSSCTKNNTRLLAAKDLDGFFEHMRSGIIDIDHHSMSPAIQFNNVANNTLKSQAKSGHEQRQLTQLNHFQSISNASSQPIFYNGQPSNGTNSMATTISDLSPSSGSASTSLTNPPINHIQQQQQQQMMANQQRHRHQQQQQLLMRHQPPANCDYSPNTRQEQLHHPVNYSGDYQGGYNDDSVAHQMIMGGAPPIYPAGHEMYQQQHQLVYPAGNGGMMLQDVIIERDRFGNPIPRQQQPGAYQIQQDPVAFSHIL